MRRYGLMLTIIRRIRIRRLTCSSPSSIYIIRRLSIKPQLLIRNVRVFPAASNPENMGNGSQFLFSLAHKFHNWVRHILMSHKFSNHLVNKPEVNKGVLYLLRLCSTTIIDISIPLLCKIVKYATDDVLYYKNSDA